MAYKFQIPTYLYEDKLNTIQEFLCLKNSSNLGNKYKTSRLRAIYTL